jgi:amino acid adenylation domain-containing protein
MPSEDPSFLARPQPELEIRIRKLSPSALSRLERALRRNQNVAESGAIPRRVVQDTAPLSFAQERLWFLEQLAPGDAAYHLALLTPLKDVSLPVLKRCLYDLTRRHESLRTTIGLYRGEPVQHVNEPFVPPLTERDLSGLSGAKRDAAWRVFSTEETTVPFDHTRGPLWRCCLYRLSERDFVLQCVMHHIISDGWSLQILEREIHALLTAYSGFEPSPLAPLPIQFADFAAWQREQAAKHGHEQELEYWRAHLRGVPALLELPFCAERPARPTADGASRYFTVSASTAQAARILAEREGTTLFVFFLSVFKLLIAKYASRDDIVVGVPIAGRSRPEVASLIGFFVNTLVLRSHLQRQVSFRALLHQVRETSLEAQSHQDIPFEKLVSSLAPVRTLDHNPLFQIAFSLETGIDAGSPTIPFSANPEASAFAVSQLLEGVYQSRAKFDLTFQMVAEPHGLLGICEYRTELYEEEVIADFIRRFLGLVETCAAAPDTLLAEIAIAEETESIAAPVTYRDLGPWVAALPNRQANEPLQASVRDRDKLPMPLGTIGQLYLRGPNDLQWTPTGLSAVRGFDGELKCHGPAAQQVLINGRQLNLAMLAERLRAACPVNSLTIAALREEGARDAIAVTATAAEPEATWRTIVTTTRELCPWLSADLRCRVRPDGSDDAWVESTVEGNEAAHGVPATPTEAAILGAFLRTLGIQQAGPEENFFDLGGDSLRAFRAVAEIRTRFGVDVPLMDFFENPTAAALAEIVRTLQAQAEDGLGGQKSKAVTRDVASLSYGQEQIWLAHQMNPAAAVYNVPLIVPLKRPVETGHLQRAIDEVVRRHEVLRSTFVLQSTGPVQIPSDTARVALEITDFSHLSRDKRWDVERAVIEAEATRPFDLENGPILRARLFCFGAADYALMLTLHHIACDGRSAEILRHEITALYDAFELGLPSPLPELPRQYSDYCQAQRTRLTPARRETLLRHWNKVLEGAPVVLDLPFARERPAVRSNRGHVLEFELPENLRRAVHRLAAAENSTEVMVLLACFKILLYRYTGLRTILVGTAVTDRVTEEYKNLIGYFANTVVLCTQLEGGISFREALARVRRTQLDAYDHQELPFEILVEERAAQRIASYHPIFQIMFAFQPGWSRVDAAPVFGERRYGERIVEVNGTGTSKFDLTLALAGQGECFVGAVEYASELFPRPAIERMIHHFRILTRAALENPDCAIDDLGYFDMPKRLQTDTCAKTGVVPDTLRRAADVIGAERIVLLATPDSPAFLLGESLGRDAAVKSLDIGETNNWSGAVVIAEANRLVGLSPTSNDAAPRRILCFGTRLPAPVRRTWSDAWLNRVTLFHGCPLNGLAAWTAESAAESDPVWHFADGVQGFIGDARGRPVAPGVKGLITTAQAGPSSVRAQELENGRFRILGEAGRHLALRDRMTDLDSLENGLCAHPDVSDAAVIAIWEGNKPVSLRAYLIAAGRVPSPKDLIRYLRTASPTGAVPDEFYLAAQPLPRDPWGRIDEALLLCAQAQWLSHEPAQSAPTTPRLAALRQLWVALLGGAEIDIEDNFFDLGGTSLIAVQILNRVRAMYGTEIGIGDFFTTPTLAGLDALITVTPVMEPSERGPALVAVPRDPPPPLSFAQERLWFLHQFQPETPVYNVAEVVPLGSDPNFPALQRALNILTSRHEILRTSFPRFGGMPAQLVHPLGLTQIKITACTGTTQGALGEAISAEIWRPFDLETGPLFRATLIRRPAGEALLLLMLHHIITDAWSMQILKSEFLALYCAASEDRSCNLPQPPIQYADYAVWERRRLRGAKLDALMAFWRGALKDTPALLGLPTDRPRPAHQSFAGSAVTIGIPCEVAQGLHVLARVHGTTPFVAHLAAFAALLHRLTGQADLVIGTAVVNRERPELEQVCGFFANTIVIRSLAEPEECFSRLLDRIAAALMAALSHSEIPFEKLVEELQPQRDPSRNPLFQAMFVHDDRRRESLGSSPRERPTDRDTSTIVASHRTAKFDLTMQVIEDVDGLLIIAEFATALFDTATIARWLEYHRRFLCAVVAAPDTQVATIPLLRPEELLALTAAAPLPAKAQSGPDLLHLLFETQAACTPEAVALEHGDEAWSYRALDHGAALLARSLVARGVSRGKPVGIYLERPLNFGIAVLAVLKSGGACLVLDPQYPQARLSLMLEDAVPPVILADNNPPEWMAARWTCLPVKTGETIEPDSCIQCPDSEDAAYIVYTSGSTGRPKGVVMPHRALTNLMAWQLRRSGLPAPRTLQLAPLSFDVAFQEMFATWGGGGSLIFISGAERRDPGAILARIEASEVERIYLPYVLLDQLAQEIRRRGRAPPSLSTVITAGEALKITPDIVAWFRAAPHCRLFNQYGPAETHVVTEEAFEGPTWKWPALPPIGRPIDGTAVFIVDERLRPTPPGVIGEIVVAGKALARGYLNRPEETAARFVRFPADGRLIYRTGDLGRLDGRGRIEFLGRGDQQLKIRGFRIEPGEIEAALKRMPGTADAVVIARGESATDRYLAGYVVPHRGVEDFDPEPIYAELRRTLPEHMRPRVLIAVPRIPLTPSGKQDREALARMPAVESSASGGRSPRTQLEQRIAGIWRDLLRRECIDMTENFFELGGHSLLAMRLVSQLGEAFQIDLPVRTVFDAPTIEALSREIVLSLVRQSRKLITEKPRRDRYAAG